MTLSKKDFPVLEVSSLRDAPSKIVQKFMRHFAAANKGSDEKRFIFAYVAATFVKSAWVHFGGKKPAAGDMKKMRKTLQSCLGIFESLAGKGNVDSMLAAAQFRESGAGYRASKQRALAWLRRAQSGCNDIAREAIEVKLRMEKDYAESKKLHKELLPSVMFNEEKPPSFSEICLLLDFSKAAKKADANAWAQLVQLSKTDTKPVFTVYSAD